MQRWGGILIEKEKGRYEVSKVSTEPEIEILYSSHLCKCQRPTSNGIKQNGIYLSSTRGLGEGRIIGVGGISVRAGKYLGNNEK